MPPNFKMSFWAGPKIIVSNWLNGFSLLSNDSSNGSVGSVSLLYNVFVGNTLRTKTVRILFAFQKQRKIKTRYFFWQYHTYVITFESTACVRTTKRNHFFFLLLPSFSLRVHIAHENKINVKVLCGFGSTKGVDVRCTCFVLTFF